MDFQADKQFKRIDYMRRHVFKRVSESTLAYLSDCPMKVTLNILKDYYPECLNASLNESYSEDGISMLDASMDDKQSLKSFLTSQTTKNQDKMGSSAPPTGFTKKPPAAIYENNEVMSRLEEDVKLAEKKKLEQRRAAEAKERSRREKNKSEKEKDKECVIY